MIDSELDLNKDKYFQQFESMDQYGLKQKKKQYDEKEETRL